MPQRAATLSVLLLVAGGAAAEAQPDYAREQRWAAQVAPGLVVGDAVYLAAPPAAKFLGIYTAAERPRGAVLLAHGPGLHPDHGITGELRVALADGGFSTLSLQMPVLSAENDDGGAYRQLFPQAAERIAAGVKFLNDKGFARVALVTHAMGSGMAYEYLRRRRDAPVAAWAALSFYGVFEEVERAPYPILDLYCSGDYRGIRGPAAERKRILDTVPGSRQLAAPDGGRFLAGGEKTVIREVQQFLDMHLK
jgi:pimeloyl-ACP methyl ester carboxylesterase